jgi:3'-phosphoadenosine 5'-phosphosulfate sulfotransferase (PAPS reductase)/FAD synthetase
MEALSIRKRMMPNRVMRFCTYELKIKTFLQYQYDNFIAKGIDYINIVGVRREESKTRANTECFKLQKETIRFNDGRANVTVAIKVLYPIVYWDTQRVFDYIKSHGLEVNLLYKKGFSRVGCYPCIYARKHDLQNIEDKYKERLRNLEKTISDINGKPAKFFSSDKDKYLRETLDIDLGCINQYGVCE